MEGTSARLELADPPLPGSLIPDPAIPAWWIAAGAVVLLLLLVAVIALVWMIVRQKRRSADPASLRNAAFREAADALAEIKTADVRSGATQGSLILRRYLATVCGDPALFETHEEFISRHDSLKDLSESAREAARSEFDRLVRLKYSPETPQVAVGEIAAGCGRLLETLHRGGMP